MRETLGINLVRFSIYASSPEECETRRAALMKVMYSGWVNLQVKGKTSAYKFYYKSSSDFDTVTDVAGGTVVERWKMKFREPKPGAL